jgi:hypothetical protein
VQFRDEPGQVVLDRIGDLNGYEHSGHCWPPQAQKCVVCDVSCIK